MHPKDADGMANSVDPDQTASSEAVWSWSALFAETYLSQYIEFVRYQRYIALLNEKIETNVGKWKMSRKIKKKQKKIKRCVRENAHWQVV